MDAGTSVTPPAPSGLDIPPPPPQQVHIYMYMKLLALWPGAVRSCPSSLCYQDFSSVLVVLLPLLCLRYTYICNLLPLLLLQVRFELPPTYQECLEMVMGGRECDVLMVGRLLRLPPGYHQWQIQTVRHVL